MPYLFLGNQTNSQDIEILKKLNITHIINCAYQCDNNFEDDFKYLHLKIFDTSKEKISKHFENCEKFIKEAKEKNGNVFVHCQNGISRSVTIIISFLIKNGGKSLEDAL